MPILNSFWMNAKMPGCGMSYSFAFLLDTVHRCRPAQKREILGEEFPKVTVGDFTATYIPSPCSWLANFQSSTMMRGNAVHRAARPSFPDCEIEKNHA